jgi:hypothetical protein
LLLACHYKKVGMTHKLEGNLQNMTLGGSIHGSLSNDRIIKPILWVSLHENIIYLPSAPHSRQLRDNVPTARLVLIILSVNLLRHR